MLAKYEPLLPGEAVLFGDQLVIANDFFAVTETPTPLEGLDMLSLLDVANEGGEDTQPVAPVGAATGEPDLAPLAMLAKYVLLLPVVPATLKGLFGYQLVIEYDFFGPPPPTLLPRLDALLILDSPTDM